LKNTGKFPLFYKNSFPANTLHLHAAATEKPHLTVRFYTEQTVAFHIQLSIPAQRTGMGLPLPAQPVPQAFHPVKYQIISSG
jgi:hypothetical protein